MSSSTIITLGSSFSSNFYNYTSYRQEIRSQIQHLHHIVDTFASNPAVRCNRVLPVCSEGAWGDVINLRRRLAIWLRNHPTI